MNAGDSQQRELQAWYREAERALAARQYRRTHELCLQMLSRSAAFAGAYYLLAIIALEHGNFAKAHELLERAVVLEADRPEFHAQLARCLIALQRIDAAAAAARQALRLQPQTALTLDTIGVVLSHVGAHAEAVAPLRGAVALAPQQAGYQYNLGAALQFSGDLQGARRAFLAAVQADPRHHRAWWSLAQVSHAPFEPAQLAALERLLSAPLDVDAELHLRHALAKHHEDVGAYEQAFEQLKQGKQRKRATLRYSFDEDRATFAAARATLPGQQDSTVAVAAASRVPIFVVGMPRTGTTLVERILGRHPQVFAAGELGDFPQIVKRAAATPTDKVIDAATLRAAADLDPIGLGEAYLHSTRTRTGTTPFFVDKLPLNFFYVGLIRRALPQARIVCVRRDPLDTCLSNYRQLFAIDFPYYHYTYDLLDTGRYFLQFDALMQYWRSVIAHSYYEVHYEAIVADTEAETRRLLEFCGLSWHPDCVRFHESTAPVTTASAVQVRRPIYRSSVQRWRKYERQLQPLRELLGAGEH